MELNKVNDAYSNAVKGMEDYFFEEKNGSSWYNHVNSLKIQLKNTYLIVVFQQQITNGGIEQYFSNGYGYLFALDTIKALKEINALFEANILVKAYELVNFDKKSKIDFRKEYFSDNRNLISPTIEVELEKLDDVYYSSENTLVILEKYLEQNYK